MEAALAEQIYAEGLNDMVDCSSACCIDESHNAEKIFSYSILRCNLLEDTSN